MTGLRKGHALQEVFAPRVYERSGTGPLLGRDPPSYLVALRRDGEGLGWSEKEKDGRLPECVLRLETRGSVHTFMPLVQRRLGGKKVGFKGTVEGTD